MEWRYLKAVRPLAIGMSALVVFTGGAMTGTAAGSRDVQIGVIENEPLTDDTILLDPTMMNVEVNWTDQSVNVGDIRMAEPGEELRSTVELGEVVGPVVTQSNTNASTTQPVNFSTATVTGNTTNGTPTRTNGVDVYPYTGGTISPTPLTVTITVNGTSRTLTAGTDFEYDRNTNMEARDPGSYSLTIRPVDTSQYSGEYVYNWRIADNSSASTTSGSGAGGSSNSASTNTSGGGTTTAGTPVITGITNGMSYCESVTFRVTGTSAATVTANGSTIAQQSDGSYRIVGTSNDQAGAKVDIVASSTGGTPQSMTIYVYQSHQYGAYVTDNVGNYALTSDKKKDTTKPLGSLTRNLTQTAKCSHGCGVDSSTELANTAKNNAAWKNNGGAEFSVTTKNLNNVTSNSGRYEMSYNVATNGLDVEVSGLNDSITKSSVVTEKEKELVNGGKIMRMFLDVEELRRIESAENSEFNRVDPNRSTSERAYFDISLYKQMDGGALTRITDTGSNQIQVTIGIPTSMRGASAYSILRYHNNQATVITPSSTTASTVTFRTDKFSTYALTYSGTATGGSSTVSGNSVSGNAVSGSLQSSSSTTGDTANARRSSTGDSFAERLGMQLTILLVAAIGLVYCLNIVLRGRRK